MSMLKELQEATKDKRPINRTIIPSILGRDRSSFEDQEVLSYVFGTEMSISDDGEIDILPEPIVTDEIFTSIKYAGKIIDPNDLLVDAIDAAFIQTLNEPIVNSDDSVGYGPENFDAIKLIGLALRLGADPNYYVKMVSPNIRTNFHILYYIWNRTPKSVEELEIMYGTIGDDSNNKNTESGRAGYDELIDNFTELMYVMMGMLVIKGSDRKSPVTDVNMRIKEQKNPQVESFIDNQNFLKSVEFNIITEGRYEDEDFDVEDESDNLIPQAVRAMVSFKIHEQLGKKMIKYIDDDPFIQSVVVLTDDETAVTKTQPSLQNIVKYHATRCLERAMNTRDVTYDEAEMLLQQAIISGNVEACILLIERGTMPKYNLVDKIIIYSKIKSKMGRPLTSAIMNGILAQLAYRGVGIDQPQIVLIESYSMTTAREIKAIQSEPYWKRTCRTDGDGIRKELHEQAREMGLPADLSKRDICEEFETIDKAKTDSLQTLAINLQNKRLLARKTKIGDLVTGRTPKIRSTVQANVDQTTVEVVDSQNTICVNEDLLPRQAAEFQDLDIVLTASKGNTYCFTTEDYQQLIESKVNIHTGEKLPSETLNEITAKWNTLVTNKLPLESKGPIQTIDEIKATQINDKYDKLTKERMGKFMTLASNNYNIPVQVFTEDLSNEDLEEIANRLLESNTSINKITFNLSNRDHVLRSFGNTLHEEIDKINTNPETSQDQLDTLMESLQGLIDEIMTNQMQISNQPVMDTTEPELVQ